MLELYNMRTTLFYSFFNSTCPISLLVNTTTATKINAPPTSVIGSSRSANSHAASNTVTTGSSVDSMAALVGPIRSSPARKVA